jgi:Protein of unknown function (DUF2783)
MKIDANIQLPDDFYAAIIEAHEGLTEQESFELNARMVFLLANQIGKSDVLLECVELAKAL